MATYAVSNGTKPLLNESVYTGAFHASRIGRANTVCYAERHRMRDTGGQIVGLLHTRNPNIGALPRRKRFRVG